LNIHDLFYPKLRIKIRETSSLSDHLEMKMRGIEQQLSSFFIDLMFPWVLFNKMSNSEGSEDDRGKEGGG